MKPYVAPLLGVAILVGFAILAAVRGDEWAVMICLVPALLAAFVAGALIERYGW